VKRAFSRKHKSTQTFQTLTAVHIFHTRLVERRKTLHSKIENTSVCVFF